MKTIIFATIIIAAGIILAASWYTFSSQPLRLENFPTAPTESALPSLTESPTTQSATTRILNLTDEPNIHPAFALTATIPTNWQVEVIPGIEAVNVYDPTVDGTIREQSQIFLRHFSATDFLTLSTVTIHSRTADTINGRPAVRYDISKNPTVANFPEQPSWRNTRHQVTDIRLSTSSPSEFLVIAKNPTLNDATFQQFVNSITPTTTTAGNQVILPPADGFAVAVTKKPFGIYINPENSPVAPERFQGYHTAADAELPAETPIVAVAPGTVRQSGRVSGYGGMIVIEHTINNRPLFGIYGHLDPDSLLTTNQSVTAGMQIGILGQAFSPETDGERAHLHFGLYQGETPDIRGYVANKEALSQWIDPLTLL